MRQSRVTHVGPAQRPRDRARPRPAARALLALTLAPAMTLLALAQGPRAARAQEPAPVVYVYLHTDSKFAELERVLKGKLPGLTVTVFGRFRDFEEAMTARPPDAVLGVGALLANLGVRPALQGLRANQDWETYALLSVGDAFERSVAGKAIGVVDLLGRQATQDFVATLLGVDPADIKVKRVTKREDLLPLLQLALADGVVAPAASVRDFTERSRLPLRIRDLPVVHVRLPAVGVRNPDVRERVVSQIRALDAATNQMLGVDAWRVP